MKKTIVTGIAFLAVLIACHKKTVPAATAPPPPAEPTYTAAAIEAGKIIYETKCTRCHAPKPVQDYTTTRWVGILRAMVPKARLDSVQTIQLTAYVNTNAKKS